MEKGNVSLFSERVNIKTLPCCQSATFKKKKIESSQSVWFAEELTGPENFKYLPK